MKKFILLFINGELGLELTEYVLSDPDSEISGIVLNSEKKRSSDYLTIIEEIRLKHQRNFPVLTFEKGLWSSEQFNSVLAFTNLGVVALFGHLIPQEIISKLSPSLVNLHPSLLPLGRGADPVAWAIIEGEKQGATIHVVEETLDTGPIILQTEIPTSFGMSSGQIYRLASEELLNLYKKFHEIWPETPTFREQVGRQTNHTSSELESLRKEILFGSQSTENILKVVQALSFNDGRAMRIRVKSGETWEIRLTARQIREGEN
jgi:methionyl-tRNA formyltransferase